MDKRGSTKNGLSALAYLFIAIFIVVSPVSAGTKDHPLKFSIRLSGEAGFISVGDINTGLRTFNNNPLFKDIRKTNPTQASLEGNIETLNGLFVNSEAELRIDFLRIFGLGIAVSGSKLNRRNESFLRYTIIYDSSLSFNFEYSYEPEIMTSAPYKVSLYYYWRQGAKASIYFNGGIGYYKGKMSEQFDFRTYDDPLTFDMWTNRHWETEWKSTMGFHAGAGMEIQMGRKLRIFTELQGRYARIGNFRAIQQYETGAPSYEATTGWLYYFTKENQFVGVRHADLTVWEVPPEGSVDFKEDIRKARLDFSGISLKVGVRLSLF